MSVIYKIGMEMPTVVGGHELVKEMKILVSKAFLEEYLNHVTINAITALSFSTEIITFKILWIKIF